MFIDALYFQLGFQSIQSSRLCFVSPWFVKEIKIPARSDV